MNAKRKIRWAWALAPALLFSSCAAPPLEDPFHPALVANQISRLRKSSEDGEGTPEAVRAQIKDDLDRILEARPLCHAALLLRARVLVDGRQPKRALEDVSVLETQFGIEAETAELRALALWQRDQREDALVAFREVLDLDANNTSALLHMGMALVASGRSDVGQRYFRKVLSLDPGNADAKQRLELCQVSEGDAADLDATLTHADPVQLKRMGLLLSRTGKHERAIKALVRAVAALPRDRQVLWALAHSLAARGLTKHVGKVASALVATAPRDADWRWKVGLGLLALPGDVASKAERFFAKAAKRWPKDVRFRLGLARAYGARGKLQNATRTYERALKLAPQSGDVYGDYALFLARASLTERAVEVSRRGVKAVPDDMRLRANLMVILFDAGYLDEGHVIRVQLEESEGLEPEIRTLLDRYRPEAS